MSQPEEALRKYDAVLIIGPDMSEEYIEGIQAQCLKAGKNLCVVGDGKHHVRKSTIARAITGRVGDDTLFILDGHGNAMFGRHWISLLSGPLPARSTLSVIDTLLNITSREGVRSPTVCVFSCFAGEVASHIQRRKKGIDATIVAHGPADDSTYDNFSSVSIVRYIADGRVPFLGDDGTIEYRELVKEPDPITIIRPNERIPVVYDPVRSFMTRQKMMTNGVGVDYPFESLDSEGVEKLVYLCALRGNQRDLRELLKVKDIDHGKLLSKAIKDGHAPVRPKIVNELLKAGINPNVCDEKGCPALILAMYEKDETMLEMLLQAGANPNVCDENGHSIIFLAAILKKEGVAEALLRAGADPTKVKNDNIWQHFKQFKAGQLIEGAQYQWELDRPERVLSEIEAIAAGLREEIKIASL